MLTIRGVLQGLEHFGWDSVVVGVDRAVLLVFGVAALMSGTGLRGLVIAFVAARAVALGLTAWLTHTRSAGSASGSTATIWRDLQTTAVPFGVFLVVINLYSYVDSIMLGKMRGDAETGLYTAAYKHLRRAGVRGVAHRRGPDAAARRALFVSDRGTASARRAAGHRRRCRNGRWRSA